MIKILIDKRVVAIISSYAPQQGLSNEAKDKFYEDIVSLVSKVDDDNLLVIGGDFNGHVGRGADGYKGIHGGFGYGNRNVEGERILELGAALDKVVCNTFFKKRDSRLVTYKSGQCSTQIDYFMVQRKDWKSIKDVKVISGEEVAQQHQLLVCDLLVPMIKKVKKLFRPKRKTWKLKVDNCRAEFEAHFEQKSGETSNHDNVEDLWTSLRNDLLAASDEICGWTKGPPRHKVTWWWNADVEMVIKEKRRLWKAWKQGGNKENYLTAKRAAKRAVYAAKKKAEEERFGDVLRREDHRAEVFKIARQMKAANKDVMGENCVKNDSGKLATTDTEKLSAWLEHYKRLLNEEFEWDKENLGNIDPKIGPNPLISTQDVQNALKKMKKGKASGMSGVVTEMLLASGDVGIARMTELFNLVITEKVIPDDWNNSLIINCFKK